MPTYVRYAKELAPTRESAQNFWSRGLAMAVHVSQKMFWHFGSVAKGIGYDFELLSAVMVNEEQRDRFVEKVRGAVWTLRGKRLAIRPGVQGGTDDVRDSPALDIVKRLAEEGASIIAYDPAAMERAAAELAGLSNVGFADDPYEACQGSDAMLILTEWQQFKSLDLRLIRTIFASP